MNKLFINKIKKLLEEQRKEIVEKVKLNAIIDVDMDGDETDAIQAKILARTTAQLIARDKDKLAKIENAFRKVAEGTFGVCATCEEPIAEKRLLINPSFTTCIVCAEKSEIMNRKNRI